MIVLKQKYYSDDETRSIDREITHIYAEHGYFKEKIGRKKRASGWHIQLGTSDSIDNYTEVEEEGIDHTSDIPETLPDICVHIMSEEELKAEEEKYLEEQKKYEDQRLKDLEAKAEVVEYDVQKNSVGE